MADLEFQVPEEMQDCFGRAFDIGSRRLRREEHQVEVAEGRHFAATGAAEADERQFAAKRLFEQALDHEIVSKPHELVVEEGRRLRRCAAVPGRFGQSPGDFGTAVVERAAKDRRSLGGEFLALAQSADPAGEAAAVDDRPAVFDIEEAHVSCRAPNRLSR